MSKVASVEEKRIESAIHSLYSLFPSVGTSSYDCGRVSTKQIKDLQKKIKSREKELDKLVSTDKDLNALKKALNEVRCTTINSANELHKRVDALKRKFNLHGITPELIKEIDKLAETPPAIIESCGCED